MSGKDFKQLTSAVSKERERATTGSKRGRAKTGKKKSGGKQRISKVREIQLLTELRLSDHRKKRLTSSIW